MADVLLAYAAFLQGLAVSGLESCAKIEKLE